MNDDWTYTPTHISKHDGSDAMHVSSAGDWCLLVNECGDTWEDSLSDWEPIANTESGN